jgi:hypothetical protein
MQQGKRKEKKKGPSHGKAKKKVAHQKKRNVIKN